MLREGFARIRTSPRVEHSGESRYLGAKEVEGPMFTDTLLQLSDVHAMRNQDAAQEPRCSFWVRPDGQMRHATFALRQIGFLTSLDTHSEYHSRDLPCRGDVQDPDGRYARNAARDADYVQVYDRTSSRVVRVPWDDAAARQDVPLPLHGTVLAVATDPRRDGALVDLTSWTDPGDVYAYVPGRDPVATGWRQTDFARQPRVAEELEAVAPDGRACRSPSCIGPATHRRDASGLAASARGVRLLADADVRRGAGGMARARRRVCGRPRPRRRRVGRGVARGRPRRAEGELLERSHRRRRLPRQ